VKWFNKLQSLAHPNKDTLFAVLLGLISKGLEQEKTVHYRAPFHIQFTISSRLSSFIWYILWTRICDKSLIFWRWTIWPTVYSSR